MKTRKDPRQHVTLIRGALNGPARQSTLVDTAQRVEVKLKEKPLGSDRNTQKGWCQR